MEDVGNLVHGPLWNQTEIDLSNSNLVGPIPTALSRLVNLTYLNLSSNAFSGQIPPSLSNLTNLAYLDLSFNKLLSGPIPNELGKLSSLTDLFLNNNYLSGSIPLEVGNLAKLSILSLSSNRFAGPIPPELGSLTKLTILSLYNNNLFGPLPPELGSLTKLTGLDLSNNNFSGPIPPELGSLTKLAVLILHNNDLSGPIPQELGNLTEFIWLELNNNNDLSGPIPLELGTLSKLEAVDLSSTNTTFDTFSFSHWKNLSVLSLPGPPPPSIHDTNTLYLTFEINNQTTKGLDLSLVPDSCKFVSVRGPLTYLESIRFWGGCEKGCIVNLASTRARLSGSTRRKVCLSKISVFLNGDIPDGVVEYVTDGVPRNRNLLKNEQGLIFNLTDPNFVDEIDLGPNGRAYTGVGFSRVQAGNLCGYPEAKMVAASVFGSAAVLLVLATFAIIVVARWRRRIRGNSLSESRYHILRQGGVYLWGAARAVLPVVDLATDFLVLSEVWGAWPMWVLLASVGAPFAFGAYVLAKAWASARTPLLKWKGMRVRWLWPLPELGEERLKSEGTNARYSWLLAIVLLPLGLVGILVQDLLSVAERFGVHLAWGDEIVVFERYHESRVMVELLLESLPQAVFQTGLYIIGSSRATRIYIDERIFVQSIVVSLCSMPIHYCTMLWEAVYEGKTLMRVFLDRFESAGQPIIVTVTPTKDEEEMGRLSLNSQLKAQHT
ncbi:hypothetical protein KFL_004840040 [Klebsormidium nitens]|uniref:LRR receptor-like serine/threonine-protein kinase FLS2 n=1 Tax=Klebsormidium nitens TaxID=105231 RepID=A0A1Y1IDN2_KLENI|nr:hypothetical protein KFL_004840040 [Klebsormidium nitens]|eukprot:GAQ89064.1 hypothetical protein KFL_004840040 [Klebsormidium nitens]